MIVTPASQTRVQLSWQDNATNEAGYRVEKSPNGIDTWTLVTTMPANITYASHFNASPNTLYYYRVFATNSGGSSLSSNIVSATTPSGLATATTNDATNISSNAATLKATVNPNMGGTTVRYRFGTSEVACDQLPLLTSWDQYIGEGSVDVSPIAIVAFPLTQITTYYFCVVATNPTGIIYGNVKSFTTL